MPLHVTVENFRCLARAGWTLEPGVSLLVGPNGSGKTTLLEVPALLRDAMDSVTQAAVDPHGGPGTIVRVGADAADGARIVAAVDKQSWELDLRRRGATLDMTHRIMFGGALIVAAPLAMRARNLSESSPERDFDMHPEHLVFTNRRDGNSPEMKLVTELSPGAVLAFRTSLGGYRLHGRYGVGSLRLNGSRTSSDLRLNTDGTNAFSVLRNWREARADHTDRRRFEFVLSAMTQAFPEAFDHLDFESAGQTITSQDVRPTKSGLDRSRQPPRQARIAQLRTPQLVADPLRSPCRVHPRKRSEPPIAVKM